MVQNSYQIYRLDLKLKWLTQRQHGDIVSLRSSLREKVSNNERKRNLFVRSSLQNSSFELQIHSQILPESQCPKLCLLPFFFLSFFDRKTPIRITRLLFDIRLAAC
jgi:hypothetical protein